MRKLMALAMVFILAVTALAAAERQTTGMIAQAGEDSGKKR